MTTGTLVLIILVAILTQVGIAALIVLRRRRRQYRELDGGSGESNAHSAAQTSMPPTSPTEAWTGFREFSVQRREYEDEGRSICSFYLVPCDGKPLPAFRPGQFLTFRLAVG
ncbi:MAG: FAD/NAD(P)-binding oxidoreductase, partial [Sedimenticolaceae bacterium]